MYNNLKTKEATKQKKKKYTTSPAYKRAQKCFCALATVDGEQGIRANDRSVLNFPQGTLAETEWEIFSFLSHTHTHN